MNPCPFCKSINLWHSDYEPMFTACLDCHEHYWADSFLSDAEWALRLTATASFKRTLLCAHLIEALAAAWSGSKKRQGRIDIMAFYPGGEAAR